MRMEFGVPDLKYLCRSVVDMGLSQNPLPSLPCAPEQRKGPSDDAMDSADGDEEGTPGRAPGRGAAADGDAGMAAGEVSPGGDPKT